ncbi:SGNH/GDSL hydrolase family protein [Jeotgalibaca sp. MA1X17-3]|uniref:SGNH/GDSL hydrolase family protein n=1 Tax=Jeotgalibaca sp. MA1X17-3 TaxID=2908211 RepID=UPI001F21FDB1|nr:SGNH/GDSL hydrolase family protein [Jeotgalibaca sp. MA1X17-3]UJF15571.1 SGNH/GDSL hydrolase family protein [Jeotgalibaca sp. MA1X17-3]
MELKKNDLILFIGDSITDVGRNREEGNDLGHGYPLMVAGALAATYPELQLQFLNRGISGNKITDLENRWAEDCISLQPDIVSILIGINDTWHHVGTTTFASQDALQEFEEMYRLLLNQVKNKTNAQIVILEPFVLSDPIDRLEWRTDLDPRIQIIRRLATEFAVDFIPLDGLLNSIGMKTSFQYLTGDDGVHPTVAGHGMIAKAWLEAVKVKEK